MVSGGISDNQALVELSQYTQGVGLADLKSGAYEDLVDDSLQDRIEKYEVHLLHSKTKNRHFKLKRLIHTPYMITAVGDISLLDCPLLGVVGPRKTSLYAQEVLVDLFDAVKNYSLVSVSGGAVGVDSICHGMSVKLGIPTIVVLGEGLRLAMQNSKRHLISEVVQSGGLVISEFPLDMPATKWSFPQRNRIVAGISEVLFVPAAGKKSGSLISVDYAIQMHVPVYTVPGSMYDPTSAGSNEYLSRGAVHGVIVFDAMLGKYFTRKDMKGHSKVHAISLTDQQQSLLARLPATKNALMRQGVSLAEITLLEIAGHVGLNESGEMVRKTLI